ncbi:putative DNA helicase ino80 [Binucleata daphniae]
MHNPALQAFLTKHNIKPKNCITASSIISYKQKNSKLSAYLNNLTNEADIFEAEPQIFSSLISIQKALKSFSAPKRDEQIQTIFKETYQNILKQIPKQLKHHKTIKSIHYQNLKKVGIVCVRELKRALSKTSKTNPQLKAKKISKELNNFYKRQERGSVIKKSSKSISIQKRKEMEEKENQRQKRKLNFLINQTELFGHFMRNKNKDIFVEETEQEKVTFTGDETKDYEAAKSIAMKAAMKQKEKLDEFDNDEETIKKRRTCNDIRDDVNKDNDIENDVRDDVNKDGIEDDIKDDIEDNGIEDDIEDDVEEVNKLCNNKTINLLPANNNVLVNKPAILNATLKSYQLQGLTWLVNLYDQGINGILADDMGLGKTVQSISFLAHLYEKEKITGPFLIVTPASTLHNWIAEFKKFLPSFVVASYWGSINERKNIRKLFSRANVVVTSYQMMVTDEKIFKRTKWHYMILDEAQAIKSSSSLRWKTLLSIACRNRLLLTGTPIQNTMAELWALLHFIMPTLFDSHDEFNAWFSKDIEKEGKRIDDVQLQRLHMILKPFMLRREKSDVKDELGIKTEKDIFCEMSKRQKRLYKQIENNQKISGEITSNGDVKKSGDSKKNVEEAVIDNKNVGENTIDIKNGEEAVNIKNGGEADNIKSENAIDDNILQNLDKLLSNTKNKNDDALFNIVMQLRKVCNHPDLFEREEVTSGLCFEKNEHFSGDYLSVRSRSKIEYEIGKKVGDFVSERKVRHEMINKKISEMVKVCELNKYKSIINQSNNNENKKRKIEIHLERIKSENRVVKKHSMQNVINAKKDLQKHFTKPVIPSTIKINSHSYDLDNIHKTKFERSSNDHLIKIPKLGTFITDSGKLFVLDALLAKLKSGGHRVLVYFQMTRMMDLMEDYLVKKGYSYLRLDGSSRLNTRRDVVNNWQTSDDKFVFLLSTRAGGLGINLTAADTVIFYDSDWNPTVDQQAMDRAHRLGQTKDVTVYRLITKGTIEERVMEKAMRKGEIQKMVIQGGDFNFNDKL